MAALWALGGVSIYVDSLARNKDGIWAEIDVINATATTLHWFGSKSLVFKITAHFWGTSNAETLEGFMDSASTRSFTGPNTFSKTVAVKRLEARRIPDKTDITNEFYRMEAELMVQ